jgi:hypothetical protein
MTLPSEPLKKRKVWCLQKDEKEKKIFVGPCGKLNLGHIVKFQSANQPLLSEGIDLTKCIRYL